MKIGEPVGIVLDREPAACLRCRGRSSAAGRARDDRVPFRHRRQSRAAARPGAGLLRRHLHRTAPAASGRRRDRPGRLGLVRQRERRDPAGSRRTARRSRRSRPTGGFTLGLAFDGDRALFACDLRHAAVFRLDLATRELERFTQPGIRIPNYPVVDAARRRLLVSDSHDSATSRTRHLGLRPRHRRRRPLVSRAAGLRQRHGAGARTATRCWSARPSRAASRRIPIGADGSAGDGHALCRPTCPACPTASPSTIAARCSSAATSRRASCASRPAAARAEIYIEDPTAHLFATRPTSPSTAPALYTANLGRWHITRVDTDTTGTAASRCGHEDAPR